ncbi:hypothetical protein V8B55DRAFT_1413417 [Mucor lusitanicus]|uniref:Uncharacterized protein n=2 Tax=Mucor circinelloides f. lusitanicus TaxID=29924 RepID=A0A168GSH2_MUCCL|nr:hypothetical protein FB192DRAFT_1470746 [Mucor lusitanicus]OAC97979.1 hypothetical protein MUCCIDRAFT_168123 [Mucor lusitanicus CBS 277.49]
MSKEMSFLQCKICQKEFPKYDQRGFRNAGFTAHQNRCIEKEYLSSHPATEPQQPAVNRQRMLLPAPSSPRHHSLLTPAPAPATTTVSSNLYTPMPTTEELLDTANVPLDDSVIVPSAGLFPITHCDHCTPEYGLHQVTCLVIAEIVNQDI